MLEIQQLHQRCRLVGCAEAVGIDDLFVEANCAVKLVQGADRGVEAGFERGGVRDGTPEEGRSLRSGAPCSFKATERVAECCTPLLRQLERWATRSGGDRHVDELGELTEDIVKRRLQR